MKVVSIRTNNGPSVYHSRPTLVMTLDLQEWADIPSNEVPDFIENLLKMLPGLSQHTCSPGYVGGFVERLKRGTYMGHIVEHIAIELSNLSGHEISYGKTRYAGQPGLYEVVTRFKNEEGMQECMRQAVSIAKAAVFSETIEIQEIIIQVKKIISETALGPSGQALVDAALKKGIPFRRLGEHSLIQLGYGKNIRRVQAAVSSKTSNIAVEIAQDKFFTKQLLSENFLPVPEGLIIKSISELESAMQQIAAPYAIKPVDGNHGNGVALNLISKEEVARAFQFAQSFSRNVLIEEMCTGKDYRILVIDGVLAAAAERLPPFVVGDGTKTILQLIEKLNLDPRRGEGHMNTLTKIDIDETLLSVINKSNLSLEHILNTGEKIILRENANLSSGGTATDVTDQVHPDIKILCERAARVVGLDICGLDLIHSDISHAPGSSAKIIEVNAGPGLRMHLAPNEGKARPVGERIIDMLYPTKESARIPIVAVTGTNGKTTTVRMIHKVLSSLNACCVGLTTTDGIWIGGKKIFTGDTTGPKSSQLVLSDPTVGTAVLEVARGGLLRGGLAYDWSDVAVVTNISPDHIGQNGIDDLEDLLWIKSLVAERVKENGTVVLNADDELTLSIQDNPRVLRQNPKFFLFSKNEINAVLQNHISAGGSACWIENSWIMVRHNGATQHIAQVHNIPATMGGLAEFQIYNVLASIAACAALGTEPKKAIEVLKTFHSGQENLGRFNIYKIRDSYIVLDYGHNQEALSSVGRIMKKLKGYQKTAVIALPGDRSTKLIKDTAAELSGHYNRFILKDDDDLRGRKSGEVPAIVREEILNKNPSAKTEIILNEIDAVKKALDQAGKNEIIAIFYDNLKNVQSLLLQYDPQPVDSIPFLEEKTSKIPLIDRTEKQHAQSI